MGTDVDVAMTGALGPFEAEVRRAWHRCLPAPAPSLGETPTGATRASAPDLTAPVQTTGDQATPHPTGRADEPDAPGVVHIPALPSGTPEEQCAAALDALSTAVTLEGILRHRGRSLLFHAAGLADPETGATTVLVASSGTGKTTAAASLGHALEYVSDETVCVDPTDLRVHPYPKPLSVLPREGGPKRQVPPGDLGLRPVTREGRLRSLVLLERQATDAADPAPAVLSEPLPLVVALSSLVPNISALPSLPRPLSTLVRTVAACGGVRAARYREIDDVAALLVHTATAPLPPRPLPGPLVSWTPDPAVPAVDDMPSRTEDQESAALALRAHGTPDRPLPGQVALSPWAEALENPEEPTQLLLLLADRFLVLDGIAPTVWHACRTGGPRTVHELAAALREEHGENPRAEELTRACVDSLLDLGALRLSEDRAARSGTDWTNGAGPDAAGRGDRNRRERAQTSSTEVDGTDTDRTGLAAVQ